MFWRSETEILREKVLRQKEGFPYIEWSQQRTAGGWNIWGLKNEKESWSIPEHGRSKFSAIMTTYQLWLHFYTLSANREHGREHNILVLWSCKLRIYWRIFGVSRWNEPVGFLFFHFSTSCNEVLWKYNLSLCQWCYFYSTVCLKNITR